MGGSRYRAGDWVVIRSKEEILATLDADGALDGMPFQPEMLALCGKKIQIQSIAHKTCEYSTPVASGRHLRKSVHLSGGRCDGSAHDGCQQNCLLFWRDEWLRPADEAPASAAPVSASARVTEADLHRQTRVTPPGTPEADVVYRCQTTHLRRATAHLHFWDPRQYIDDVTSGNLCIRDVAWGVSVGILRRLMRYGVAYRVWKKLHDRLQAQRGRPGMGEYVGPIPLGKATPAEKLDLKPGEVVEVRTWPEIEATLNIEGVNRGMRFDYEMARYLGRRYKVQSRIERIIHEKTFKMTTMKSSCIQLEGVHCRAECTERRIGCPRLGLLYWREIWLKRV